MTKVLSTEVKSTSDPDAKRIARLHNSIVFLGNETLFIAVKCGELLAKKKRAVAHGQWLAWIDANLPFTARTAQRYIQVWENRNEAQTIYELEQEKIRALRQSKHRLSLRHFYEILTDSKSVRPGLMQADKQRMIRDLVKPVRIVTRRLAYLPWTPSTNEALEETIEELHVALAELVAGLQG